MEKGIGDQEKRLQNRELPQSDFESDKGAPPHPLSWESTEYPAPSPSLPDKLLKISPDI